jgi:tetratricopeptide (TPR) repeat protein
MHNPETKDQILKIFSKVRCFNRDQLPRYVEGRLTHIEMHLLEQHLVNCELCSDAVQILEKPKYKTQYQVMGAKVQQYIRNYTYKVPHVDKAERYLKKEKNKENVLIYFWATAAVALLVGCIYMVQQQAKRDNMLKTLVKTEQVAKPVIEETVATPLQVSVPPAVSVAAVQTDTVASSLEENSDKVRYKEAMGYYLKGNLDEAMPLFTALTKATDTQYGEMARYQLAICYKFKYQKAKAREMLKELVSMNGSMKKRAQLALNKF